MTLNGRPFSIVEDSGFRKILCPLDDALNFSLNRRNRIQEITETARLMREKISKEVRGKLICVKLDAVTRLERSFLGINIQMCQNGKLVLRNLGVKEIFGSHTSAKITSLCKSTLAAFEIKPIQIYAITTDNAANMLKVSRLVQAEIEESMEETSGNSSGVVRAPSSSVSSEEPPDSQVTFTEEEMQELTDVEQSLGSEEDEEIDNEPSNAMEADIELGNTVGVRCASHTLQLCVRDAVKDGRTARTISKGRRLAKLMRTPLARGLLKKCRIRVPALDCETRFDSEFDMLDDVLTVLQSANELDKAIRNQDEWVRRRNNPFDCTEELLERLKEIRDGLQPARITSKKFQEEQLVAGDFYEAWTRCKFDLRKQVNNHLAKKLLEAMEIREDILEPPPHS